MKKIFTFLLLFGMSVVTLPALAQDIDESYAFADKDGNVIENGSTVLCNVVEQYDEGGTEVILSGVSVKNISGSASDYIKMLYKIERIDNGSYQICFPTSCNTKDNVGSYETPVGMLMGNVQDIQSEWFPTEDGECVVTLTLEILSRQGMFPPTYLHKAWGPTITLNFVKGGFIKGDVNRDGEVNIADVSMVISYILSPQEGSEVADVNEDTEVNIADVSFVIGLILNSSAD